MKCLMFSPDGSILAGGSSGTGKHGRVGTRRCAISGMSRAAKSCGESPRTRVISARWPSRPTAKHLSRLAASLWSGSGTSLPETNVCPRRATARGSALWRSRRPMGRSSRRARTARSAGGTRLPAASSVSSPRSPSLCIGWPSLLTAKPCFWAVQSLASGLGLWSVAERREIRRLSRIQEGKDFRHVGFFWSTAYSPDGKEMITVEREGVRIRDVVSGKEVRWAVRSSIDTIIPLLHLMAASWPPARSTPVVAAESSTSPFTSGNWPRAGGRQAGGFRRKGKGNDLAYSPDGRFLVACCNRSTRNPREQMIRIWDVVTGQEVRRFTGHLAPVWSVAFTADGRSVISGGADGTALVWDVSDLPNHESRASHRRCVEGSLERARQRRRPPCLSCLVGAERSVSRAFPAGSSLRGPRPAYKGSGVTEGPVGPPGGPP